MFFRSVCGVLSLYGEAGVDLEPSTLNPFQFVFPEFGLKKHRNSRYFWAGSDVSDIYMRRISHA